MDRQLRVSQRTETTLNIVAEVLDIFVQHQLTIVAHQPPFDAETGQLGLRRYRALMDQAARQLGANQGRPRFLKHVAERKDEK
jgi:hypothetical protein